MARRDIHGKLHSSLIQRIQVLLDDAERRGDQAEIERAHSFGRIVGNRDLCPDCWVKLGEESILQPPPNDAPDRNAYRCRRGHDLWLA